MSSFAPHFLQKEIASLFFGTLIYSLFMLIVTIINSDNGLDRDELLTSALVIIVWLGLLLYIPGILTRIIDDKITYEEHINKNK